jgi:anti-sigma factor RsiW
MNCKQVYRHICENLDENIHSARCRAIRRHLVSCPDCGAYLDSIKKTIALYKSIPTPKVPSAIHLKMLKALQAEMARPGRQSPRRQVHASR